MNLTYYKNYLFQVSIKKLLQYSPKTFIRIQKFRYRGTDYFKEIVGDHTDIIIEGFPRSANSFSVRAFKFDNGETYNIATHLHAYPQVIVGVNKNIPTILLIRDPYESVVSYAALRAENIGVEKFHAIYNIEWLLKDYVTFYENLLPYKEKVVVGVFSDVLNDYGKVIERVNKKFDKNFEVFNHTKENVETVFNTARPHLFPSEKRDDIKKHFISELDGMRNSKLFNRAEELYQIWSTLE